MSKKEIKFLRGIIDKGGYEYTEYSKRRLEERNITDEQVKVSIKNYDLIEFHYKDGERRVLIRGTKEFNGKNVILSLDLISRRIITLYADDVDDNHATLDFNKYRYVDKMDLISVFYDCNQYGRKLAFR
jgi:hypothetical protein